MQLGDAESGGRMGESPTPGSWPIQWVHVDNKSVAEIGERCLPWEGWRSFGLASSDLG